ncbi:MAG: hypothetical protein HYT11_02215 [Candidatus Levybacteria bacterium]|nr:hypothetical protein [Candidatus Levybacteria bacterium]
MKIAWGKITMPFFLALLVFFTQTNSVFAQAHTPFTPWGCIQISPPSFACIPGVVSQIINGFLFFSGTVAMFFIIFAGIKYLISRGDPKQIEGAKKTLTYAIVGLIVVLSAFFIINFLGYITGVELDFPKFPEPNL